MKKLAFALVAIPCLAFSAPSEKVPLRVGTVDLMLLIRNHPNYESNKALLTSTDKDYQKKLDAIKAEGEKLQEEGKKLAEQMRNPMLAAKAKSDVEKQLMDLQQKLMGIEQRYRSEAMRFRQELQDLEGRLLKTTTDDLRKRIKTFADANAFDLVLDRTAAPFAKEKFDVTGAVMLSMGIDPETAKGKSDEGK